MDFISSWEILEFYSHIDVFLVVLVRFLAFTIIFPVLSGQNFPIQSKIILSVAITGIVISTGKIGAVYYDDTLFGFFLLILKEFMVGFIIGFVVYAVFSVFYFLGQLVDYQIGYSMVSVFDPISQTQVPVTGNFYYMTIMMLLMVTGGFHYFIEVVVESYTTLPIGSLLPITETNIMSGMVKIIIEYFKLGLQMALPVVGTILIVDVALGILVKAVPQMNVFVVGMPIKVFIGLVVIMITVPFLIDSYNSVSGLAVKYVNEMIQGFGQ